MKCQCSEPGYCETHNRTMSEKQFGQCHGNDAFFDGFAKLKGRSTGLGDVVAHVARVSGIQAAAKMVERITGKPCGCGKRQDKLNEAVPFQPDASPTPTRSETGGAPSHQRQ